MIGCFGKVPAHPDFVSLRGAADEVCEFDAWLQANLAAIQQHETWPELFDRLPVCQFSYRASNGNWLLGALISSRDASSRRYPFFIFQVVTASLAGRLVNPFTLSELFNGQIKQLLHMAVHGESITALFERVKAMRPLQRQDFELFQRVHDKFLMSFNFRDIANALAGAYPEFIGNAVLSRLSALRRHVHTHTGICMPLPAERGLKNPTADLWITWLTRMNQANAVPHVSLLADDFMRPKLFCFPSRGAHSAYRVLTGIAERTENYDLLASFEAFDEHHRVPAFPDPDRPLHDVIDRFVDALDAKPV